MRLHYFLAVLAFLPTCAFAGGELSSGPEALVKAMIEQDRNAKLMNLLPAEPDEYMQRHFTKAFNASWANAMSHSKDEPVLDGDVVTGRQTATRIVLKAAHAVENGDAATVSTDILDFDDEGPKKPHRDTVRFFLRREAGSWKIDDINSGNEPSIRSYFKTSYGQ